MKRIWYLFIFVNLLVENAKKVVENILVYT